MTRVGAGALPLLTELPGWEDVFIPAPGDARHPAVPDRFHSGCLQV